MRLRDLFSSNFINDGSRSLFESILVPEVEKAFRTWKLNVDSSLYVLIGGVALSFYTKPRTTTDIDTLFGSSADIPKLIPNFKRHRSQAFQHNDTHVEIEVLTPENINVPKNIVDAIIKNANIIDGIRIATPSGLIVSKLGRFKLQDQADIEALVHSGGDIDLTPYDIPQEWQDRFDALLKQIQ